MERIAAALVLLLPLLVGGASEVNYLDSLTPLALSSVQHCPHMCINNAALLDTSTIVDLRH